MEHLLQKSKCFIFHNIFKYMIFQRRQKALIWSKGLSLYALMDYILRVTGYNFQIKIVFLSLKIVFVLVNRIDLDEMSHFAAFHMCLHCWPKHSFRSHPLCFVCVDALCPSQQFFSHVGMISCLFGLNQY